jgi:hypothetical protein
MSVTKLDTVGDSATEALRLHRALTAYLVGWCTQMGNDRNVP